MIRKYKLTKRLPVSRVMKTVTRITPCWNQEWISDADPGLEQWFIDQCPEFKTLTPSVIVHRTSGDIHMHSDGMAQSVFVFPIKFGTTTKFIVEDDETKFKRGEFYRFNDHYRHGISNENGADLVIVTVSFEPTRNITGMKWR
jgi:hypothetical protein